MSGKEGLPPINDYTCEGCELKFIPHHPHRGFPNCWDEDCDCHEYEICYSCLKYWDECEGNK